MCDTVAILGTFEAPPARYSEPEPVDTNTKPTTYQLRILTRHPEAASETTAQEGPFWFHERVAFRALGHRLLLTWSGASKSTAQGSRSHPTEQHWFLSAARQESHFASFLACCRLSAMLSCAGGFSEQGLIGIAMLVLTHPLLWEICRRQSPTEKVYHTTITFAANPIHIKLQGLLGTLPE